MNRIESHPGPQTEFLRSKADIAIYGGQAGGGKTWALLAEASRNVKDGGYGAVIFRRTSPQITNEGGLWDESMSLYPELKGEPRQHTLDWRFPSGANIGFRHLQYDSDKLAWAGSQIALIGFDELTHFMESQFWFLLSRNRSTCGVPPYVRATTNPCPDDDPVGGWVRRLIAWWIDADTGLAIPERSGVVRWFVRVNGELHWSDSKAELIERFGGGEDILPKSLTFIPAKLSDNPTLMRLDPNYKANLMALPDVERKRLAEGNWNAKAAAGTFYRIGVMSRPGMIVDALPVGLRYCRAWDLAHTEGAGDWTVGAKIGTDGKGTFYISDVVRGQWEVNGRDERIKLAAEMDDSGDDHVIIRIPEDPSAGKSEAARIVRMLAGHTIKPKPVRGDKLVRQSSFASQFNAGNVKMLAGPWNHGLLQRLDAFPTKGVNDDEGDALADAFDELAKGRITALVANTQPKDESAEQDQFRSLRDDDYVRDVWEKIARDESLVPQWRDSLNNFRNDMGDRPTELHTLRVRNKLDFYGPSNCYWGTEDETEPPKPVRKRALVAN